ncbi:MAG: MerR family transcriptional regulator, partial [Gammaproteobacteria bacterium]
MQSENSMSNVTSVMLDEHTVFSVREVCSVCGVNAELLIELVDEGVLHPAEGTHPGNWRFVGNTV